MNGPGYTVGDTEDGQMDPKGVQGEGGGRGVESEGGPARGVGLGQRFLEDKRGLPGFPYAESHVRFKLGLNKDEMRALRTKYLAEGSEFSRDKKGRVWLSQHALEMLCGRFGVIGPTPEKTAQGKPQAQADPSKSDSAEKARQAESDREWAIVEPERVVVVRANLKNPHMVLACREADLKKPEDWRGLSNRTGLLRVRVRSQEGIRTGMVLEAVRVEGYGDLYDLVPGQLRRRAR